MSRKLLIIVGIILIIISGLYFWVSKKIREIRTESARIEYLEIYAGCHARAFNLASPEPDLEKPTQTIGISNVNKYWERDSQERNFDHDDVVEYMMQHCPPKSDAEIEKVYSNKDIEYARARRDYQIKFIKKDLDIFRE